MNAGVNKNWTQRHEKLYLDLSSQVQQLIEENLKGRSPAEAFARTKIHLAGKSGEESGIENLQVGGFGAVFANEPIVFSFVPRIQGA